MTWTTTLGCVAAVAIAAITTTTTWNTVGQEPSVIKSVAIDVGRDATPTTILPSNSVLAQFGAAPAAPTAPPTPSAPVAPTPPVAPAAPVPPASPSASSKKLAEMRDMIEQAMLEPATFSVQDVGTETIAQELLKQTRLPFITDARGLAVASEAAASPTFSYQADGLPLQVALRQMLRPAALRADVRDDSIVITADTAELARQGIGAHQWVNVDQEAAIRIAEGLKVRASFEFQEEPLESVISIVSEKMGVPISIDQAGLEENGISRDMLCELNVKDLTLRSTLDSFLDQLELCLTISGEQLVVTSRDAAEQRRLLRVYWIDGLGLPSNDASSLMQLIQSSVNPDTWEELGGPSSISPVGLTPRQRPGLMVATTLDTHMEIESLVQVLRNSHFGPDTGKDIEFPTAGSPTGFGGGMAGGMGGMGGGGGGMGGGGMF